MATEGVKKILNYLEENEVFKLAATTTQHLIKQDNLKSKDEAIDIILRHSEDIPTILNRKAICKEHLFQYLDERGQPITTSVTKLGLINKIQKLWDKDDGNKTSPNDMNKEVEVKSGEENDVNTLAFKFSEWFYSILNQDSPIGEEHFWQDASLKLNLISETTNLSNSVDNDCIEVVNLLYATKNEHGLFFNPNLTKDGVRGKINNHGLVMVVSCGTLHTKESCVGIFEQMFMLARDPFSENNWKIKHTELNLKSKPSVPCAPILKDSTLCTDLLPLDDN